MRDVPTMVRTSQAVRRWKELALSVLAGAVTGAVIAVFCWVIWRAV